MAKKESLYRGMNLEQVQKLSLNEFSSLLPSSARRKIKRGFTEQEKILLKNLKSKNSVKTHCREMIILPEMIEKTIQIHSGKSYDSVNVTIEMLGHRLGEFALSRKKVAHSSPGVGATKSSSSASVK